VNDWFNPSVLIEPSQILATNGVSSLLDLVAFNLAEAGEGILVPVPMYSMFEHDLCARAGLELVPVSTNSIPDPFGRVYQDLLIAAFENSLKGAQQRQIKVKAVLISNPCNPVGRFYSRSTLTAIARFCGQNGLHLVADEIYALSEFESCVGLPRFTSVLSLAHDPKDHIFHENIHSLYGASKDWAMGGLRLGFLITRNPGIYDTCRRLA
jgi:aspartate/methionine/tyrosine aminotransferase